MSESNAQAQPIRPVIQVKPNQALIIGRIVSTRSSESGVHRTIINSAAPDQFSYPGKHEVSSTRRLGKPGDEIRVLCSVSGYSGKYTDKKTGEEIHTVNNALSVIEE